MMSVESDLSLDFLFHVACISKGTDEYMCIIQEKKWFGQWTMKKVLALPNKTRIILKPSFNCLGKTLCHLYFTFDFLI